MRTVEQAQATILAAVPTMATEAISVADSLGRYLAEPLVASVDVPPWNNSAMDGYAVRSADLASGNAVLRLNETVGAGGWPQFRVEPGTATAVMTGAPLPEGADAVVMVEDSDGSRQLTVTLRDTPAVWQYVRFAGEDVKAGTTVLEAGTKLSPGAMGLAAALGFATVNVAKRPRVAILSTGDEVVSAGNLLAPGQIYSANNAALIGLVRAAGAEPLDLGIAPDSLPALVAALQRALDAGADVILTTGGVSVGAFDFVKEAFAALGGEIDFWKVAMKPGKPLAYGRVGAVPLFGLPGNPVSCMVNFLQFVRPWLLTSMGSRHPFLPIVQAIAAEPLVERPGRFTFMRVVLEQRDGIVFCRSTGSQGSGVLSSMAKSHGFALFPATSTGAMAGDTVRVQLLDAAFLDREHADLSG